MSNDFPLFMSQRVIDPFHETETIRRPSLENATSAIELARERCEIVWVGA